jgi:hypothetical protein
MDFGLVIAIVMLAGWGIWTFAFNAPGWAHIFLTVGVFLFIYRIIVRGTPGFPTKGGK